MNFEQEDTHDSGSYEYNFKSQTIDTSQWGLHLQAMGPDPIMLAMGTPIPIFELRGNLDWGRGPTG